MKIIFSILISVVVFSSCSSSKNLSKDYKENPCEEARYLKLKEMKMSEMTGAESEYFKTKEVECEDYEKRAKTNRLTSEFIVVLSILAVIAGIVVFLTSFKFH